MERMSSKRKSTIVLRVLRGESMDEVSRAEQVTMADLSSWRDLFLSHGEQGLKRSPRGSKAAEYERVIGKLQMENELLKKKSCFKKSGSI
jgi:transposase-like protein